ncbi:MAG: hypothetical protein KDA66_11060 [Planctomycetaceae bacterium]|nr:hypothetical protein [Planctomycetaceae bacterium]MCA9174930.1 hypothetical protein [Planctomycetales bacterium]
MEARILRTVVAVCALFSMGASARTQHFLVTAPTQQMAQQVANAAEQFRNDLAIEWLGRPLGPWADICPIRVVPHQLASGETSFEFPMGGGHPRNWRMEVKGPPERILDSVLPHEILHTVFATHFQNPLPRWADEGACTTVEGQTERAKHDQMLIRFLTGDEGIPFNEMFRMREYPANILPLYSQGYSVANYLIAQGGKRKFVNYVGEGMQTNNWTATTQKYYGFNSLSDLQLQWVAWVGGGSNPMAVRPPREIAASEALVSTNANPAPAATRQSPAQAFARPGENVAMAGLNVPASPPRNLAANGAAAPLRSSDGWYQRQARVARSRAQSPASVPPIDPAWRQTAPRAQAEGFIPPPVPGAPPIPEPEPGKTVLHWSSNASNGGVIQR